MSFSHAVGGLRHRTTSRQQGSDRPADAGVVAPTNLGAKADVRSRLTFGWTPIAGGVARHAVFKWKNRIYGIAMNADATDPSSWTSVALQVDNKPDADVTWKEASLELTDAAGETFVDMARASARSMTYDLLTRNCYTVVLVALNDLRPRLGEQAAGDIDRVVAELSTDNSGAGLGSETAASAAKKNQ
ncbi:MAG: hypothetical protein U0Q15_08080 [Kineosporiaceae bacterium]